MQNYVMINNTRIKQPDAGLDFSFETTYTEDSNRLQNGVAHISSMFTVESFSYTATNLTKQEMSQILSILGRGGRFLLHYMSPFYGTWRDDYFYVGRGSLKAGCWKEDEERWDSLSFNMIGVNPI